MKANVLIKSYCLMQKQGKIKSLTQKQYYRISSVLCSHNLSTSACDRNLGPLGLHYKHMLMYLACEVFLRQYKFYFEIQ
jgi:hypothetical protein